MQQRSSRLNITTVLALAVMFLLGTWAVIMLGHQEILGDFSKRVSDIIADFLEEASGIVLGLIIFGGVVAIVMYACKRATHTAKEGVEVVKEAAQAAKQVVEVINYATSPQPVTALAAEATRIENGVEIHAKSFAYLGRLDAITGNRQFHPSSTAEADFAKAGQTLIAAAHQPTLSAGQPITNITRITGEVEAKR
jgi:hypothetical protein